VRKEQTFRREERPGLGQGKKPKQLMGAVKSKAKMERGDCQLKSGGVQGKVSKAITVGDGRGWGEDDE